MTDTVYSQRDPQWSGQELGTGKVNIGGYGCDVTTDAMIATDAGHPINPGQLDAIYTQRQLYFADPDGGNDLLGDDTLSRVFPDLAVVEGHDYTNIPADLSKLAHDPATERVKVRISAPAAGFALHFGKGLSDGVNWADPWTGTEHPIGDYGDPASIITGIFKYRLGPAVTFACVVKTGGPGLKQHHWPGTGDDDVFGVAPDGATLLIDRWCRFGVPVVINDGWPPDDRWFHVGDGSDAWVSSAGVVGEPGAGCPEVAAPRPQPAVVTPPAPPALPDNIISYQAATRLIMAQGGDKAGWVNALAVSIAEAGKGGGINANATNIAGNNPPSRDRGMFEINDYWHKEVTDAMAFDPAQACHAAYLISSGWTNFTPWSTWPAAANRHLQEAQAAVEAVAPTPTPPAPAPSPAPVVVPPSPPPVAPTTTPPTPLARGGLVEWFLAAIRRVFARMFGR